MAKRPPLPTAIAELRSLLAAAEVRFARRTAAAVSGQATVRLFDATTLPSAWREFLEESLSPDARYLVVIARDQRGLYEFFSRVFASSDIVQVIEDRRLSPDPATPSTRRPLSRRSRSEIDAELRSAGFAFVRLPATR